MLRGPSRILSLHIGPNGKRLGFSCPLSNRKGRIKLVQDGELGMKSPYEVRIDLKGRTILPLMLGANRDTEMKSSERYV